MKRMYDSEYLKNSQYRTPVALNARAGLHERFGRSSQPWQTWVFEQLDLQPGLQVLEVGCGPAYLWRENLNRLPPDTYLVLTDLSEGMIATARQHLGQDARFRFLEADVQQLVFEDASFDRVVANHMLYHVPDLALGLSQLARVLKPGGRLCAATNGADHMKELYDLIEEVLPGFPNRLVLNGRFGLENAGEILGQHFGQVAVKTFPSDLWVTEVQALIDYIHSMWSSTDLSEDHSAELRRRIEAQIDREGGFRIQRMAGVAIASL